MKSFDIELAKQGHPVQTREGSPVRIICYDKVSLQDFPIVALVRHIGKHSQDEKIGLYTVNGKANHGNKESELDLVMAPTKKEGWVNIYKGIGDSPYTGNIYPSEEEAIEHISDYGDIHLATEKIEWEE